MKDNILIIALISSFILLYSGVIIIGYKNFNPESMPITLTVEERIEQCKRLGMKVVSIDMYDTYSDVDCREK